MTALGFKSFVRHFIFFSEASYCYLQKTVSISVDLYCNLSFCESTASFANRSYRSQYSSNLIFEEVCELTRLGDSWE